MANITTGQLFSEWEKINAKLQKQIDEKPTDYPDSQSLSELKTLVLKQKDIEDKLQSIADGQISSLPSDYPDSAVKTELELIKQKNTEIKETQSEIIAALQTSNENLQSTNEALMSVIKEGRLQSDAQVTGSKVEDASVIKVETLLERQVVQSGFHNFDFDPPKGAKGAVFVLDVRGVTGTFEEGEGYQLEVILFNGDSGKYIGESFEPNSASQTFQTLDWSPTAGEINTRLSSYKAIRANFVPQVFRHSRSRARISGTFEEGEGIDLVIRVAWTT